MGMINHLGKFIPRLANLSELLLQLLRKDSVWVWEEPQQRALQQIKDTLVSPEILAYYDPKRPTTADTSNTGIGAVLRQVQDDGKRRAPNLLCVQVSQRHRETLCCHREGSPCSSIGQ